MKSQRDSYNACDDLLVDVRLDYLTTRHVTGMEAPSKPVADALCAVDRAGFVPDHLRSEAWHNRPLPIGYQQTISQPFIVALMTDLLGCDKTHRVLEVGTGCGYQAAILSRLVGEVFSVEIVPELATEAGRRLARMGYDNIHVRTGNGREGWPENAPYDGIIVTAAGAAPPPALVAQLAPGGRLVMPVRHAAEEVLTVVCRNREGGLDVRRTLAVRFVPLTGDDPKP